MLVDCMSRCPLVAILRGIAPAESLATSKVLIEAGFPDHRGAADIARGPGVYRPDQQ